MRYSLQGQMTEERQFLIVFWAWFFFLFQITFQRGDSDIMITFHVDMKGLLALKS